MICSMTGFAREAGNLEGVSFVWEIKSVNGRSQDIRVRTPPGHDAIGEEARKAVAARVARGTVNVSLTVQRSESVRALPRINQDVLAAAHRDVLAAAGSLGLQPPGLEALLQIRGVIEVAEPEIGPSDALASVMNTTALRAAAALAAARRSEGEALADVITRQLETMEDLVRFVAEHPARTPEAIRTRLEQQVRALVDAPQIDQVRLYQEAALLATRADVREEIDRLGAHIAASRALLSEGGAVGRKLDFLAQEFGREASTLCAKANHVELSRVGLELRSVVDQFREQVQNVE